jgi:hypothetical protein
MTVQDVEAYRSCTRRVADWLASEVILLADALV